MEISLNPKVDKYLIDGCMRCKYGGTPKCKVNRWRTELETLRQIVLQTGLKEEIKWGIPVYTDNGNNIVTVNALKESANIGFFKGALLTDNHNILQTQGNSQSIRLVKFTNIHEIEKSSNLLNTYILEAIEINKNGNEIELKKNPELIPNELLNAFENDSSFKTAFYKLTPGRQRGYIIYFSQPKQSLTRSNRIEKYKQHILNGIGLNDKYKR